MIRDVNLAIDEFFMETGKEPDFLILSVGAYGDFSYQVGKLEGLSDDDAYINEVSTYKEITVAVTHNPRFNNFELR